ncbi:MAG TPA: DUF2330 domain-containing protein, partial [Candidatus Atribacteria bacterium]|nr:DUF2330 domain-containing protein [Candidatus Atribacteria bacterium]
MKKIFCLLLSVIFIISPLLVGADGVVIRPLPEGDWVKADENTQQAFINYENNIEKLLIAVDIDEGDSDIVWIIPIPSKPDNIDTDIASELPFFFGDNVISKAKLNLSETVKYSCFIGLLTQIWTFPASTFFVSLSGTQSKIGEKISSEDSINVEYHIEKAGMVSEVITAKDAQAIYNYFSQKGFSIKQRSISQLDNYINKDFSFVVSWITPKSQGNENRGKRGILISFPSSKIYYPLVLTSAYDEKEIPITIRVLGHIKPDLYSEIKPYTKIDYFTERTRKGSNARKARCSSDIRQLFLAIEIYYDDHSRYPSSLQELAHITPIPDLIRDIKQYCGSSPFYSSKEGNYYELKIFSQGGVWIANSSEGLYYCPGKEYKERISPELKKFYGTKEPWRGKEDYTKITINAPAKLLEQDLWMEKGRPILISPALLIANHSLVLLFILYFLIVGIFSLIAGGLAGLICFRSFKKYALIGLSNIATLISLFYVARKSKETNQPKSRF